MGKGNLSMIATATKTASVCPSHDHITSRFTTLDAYIGGYLLLAGHRPQLENQAGKIVFVYISTPELQKAIASFYSGAQVPAAAFAASVKSLRGMIHEKRMEKGDPHDRSNFRRLG